MLVAIASHRSHCKKKLTPTVQIQEEQLQATMGQANKGYELQEVQNSENLDKKYIHTILFLRIFKQTLMVTIFKIPIQRSIILLK